MMPRSDLEARWFNGLSITAGICEELLYRGYLLWYLGAWLPWLPAILIAALIFGFGHAYQGPRGIALTTLVGLLMSAIYLGTGSLFLSMTFLALMDLHAGYVARASFRGVEAEGPAPAPVQAPESPDGTHEETHDLASS
jgi:membrane protease YdiL (CAAX protease family)